MAFRGRDLLEGLRGRDPAAIRQVVDQQARRIYRAARGLGFSPSDAEDLAQEVFVTFLETLDRFEGRSAVGTWLFGILHHYNFNRFVGVEAEGGGSFGIDQRLDLRTGTRSARPPNTFAYNGNAVV